MNAISYRILASLLKRKDTISYNGNEWPIYYGSSWWALTYECVLNLWEIINSKEFEHYFKYAYAPDELMIQTAFFNSQYALTGQLFPVTHKVKPLEALTPLHYIEYTSEIKIYKLKDIDKLLSSGKMFFRKAKTGISDSLLNHIDIIRSNNEVTAN